MTSILPDCNSSDKILKEVERKYEKKNCDVLSFDVCVHIDSL